MCIRDSVKEYPTVGELNDGVIPGTNPELMAWDGLKVGGAICFDINFEPLFARQKKEGADLLLCPSLWPGGRLLNYYAFEYSVPIVLAYPGWSRIIDPLGHEKVQGGQRNETLRWGGGSPVYTADINFDYVVISNDCDYEIIRDIESTYAGRISIHMDQQDCCFLFESLAEDVTAAQVISEYNLMPRKQLLAQALEKIEQRRADVSSG